MINLGEIDIPEKFENPFGLRIIYDKESMKYHKCYMINLGTDPKVIKDRKQKRKEVSEARKKAKLKTKKQISDLKRQKREAFQSGDYDTCKDLDTKINKLLEQV